MNKLSVYSLALLLVTGSGLALAGRSTGISVNVHYNHPDAHYKRPHYRHHTKRHYKTHHHARQQGYYYPRSYYFPGYFGAVALGSALRYSLYHMHQGTVCYDHHSGRDYRGNYHRQVVGCHRIERFPDGSQRRVDVPVSQCY